MRFMCFASLLALTPWMAHAQLSPTFPINTEVGKNYQRLNLPPTLEGHAPKPDRWQWAIVNGAGQRVAFAWWNAPEAQVDFLQSQPPFFALPEPFPDLSPSSTINAKPSPTITIDPTGNIVINGQSINPSPTPSGNPPQAYLMDMQPAQGKWLELSVAFAETINGVFPFRLEASNNLHDWHSVLASQVLRLERLGDVIVQDHYDLNSALTSATFSAKPPRYLRWTWINPKGNPTVAKFTVHSTQTTISRQPMQWSAWLSPQHCKENACYYFPPRHFPAEQMEIIAEGINALYRVNVSALTPAPTVKKSSYRNPLFALRHKRMSEPPPPSSPREHWLAGAQVYRLQQGEGNEIQSPPIDLPGTSVSVLKIALAAPFKHWGGQPPRIRLGAAPQTLVFLAQGNPPFNLAWQEDPVSSLSIAELDPTGSLQQSSPSLGNATITINPAPAQTWDSLETPLSPTYATAKTQGIPSINPTTPTNPLFQPKNLLWLVLGGLLVALLAMARSVLKTD